ncbi:hypothetical protein MHFGQ_06970 [Moorella humiferrea]|uniref:Uncharacterized protein n=1 Tax=Neomoorella humiferrea TaxID=676965 RepID=A0A2T0ANY6_9FIRM|nr:hypothetical protein MOHU_17800 [Moorella humiferrea]
MRFIYCMHSRQKSLCSGEEGEWAIQVAEAAYINVMGQIADLPLKEVDIAAGRGHRYWQRANSTYQVAHTVQMEISSTDHSDAATEYLSICVCGVA